MTCSDDDRWDWDAEEGFEELLEEMSNTFLI